MDVDKPASNTEEARTSRALASATAPRRPSPRGDKIVFSSPVDAVNPDTEIFIMNADGTGSSS